MGFIASNGVFCPNLEQALRAEPVGIVFQHVGVGFTAAFLDQHRRDVLDSLQVEHKGLASPGVPAVFREFSQALIAVSDVLPRPFRDGLTLRRKPPVLRVRRSNAREARERFRPSAVAAVQSTPGFCPKGRSLTGISLTILRTTPRRGLRIARRIPMPQPTAANISFVNRSPRGSWGDPLLRRLPLGK